MKAPSYYDSFRVLLLQLADNNRTETLIGANALNACKACEPFLIGQEFPNVYLEFPLLEDPFLDVTLLYKKIEPHTYIDSAAAQGTEPIIDWYSTLQPDKDNITFGVELDTSNPALPRAGVHFQPRTRQDLVEPFCKAAGEPERAKLYLDFDARLPQNWSLSYFGMFRGRPESPLRVCGYLADSVKQEAARDTRYMADVFDAVGFSAYNDAMLAGLSQLMAVAPSGLDFQFDIFPDGHLSDVFALDAQFAIEQPEQVQASFTQGAALKLMELFETWGIADSRWRYAVDATFARALPIEREDGTLGKIAFTLFPQWTKARWKAGVLQPAKLYCCAGATLLE